MEEEIVVTIEKLSSNGSGIAHNNGMVVFVDKTCPGDKCRVKIVKNNKSYQTGEVSEIIENSPHRVKPFCPMQNVCGACQLQYIDYDYQLCIKKEIVADALKGFDVEVKDVVPSPKNREYRHKIQYPIRQTQVSKRILAGYFKQKTHDIVNIKYCPIQPAICDEIIEYIRENAPKYKIEGYDETKHKGLLRHVVIRASAKNNDLLVVFVINNNVVPERLKDFGQNLFDKFENIKGISVNFNNKKTNLIMSDETKNIYGDDFIEEEICGVKFHIGANTFFQVNPESAENIFKYVKNYISETFNKPSLLDAYAGISAFGMVMADVCKSVVSIEDNKASVDLARRVKRLNKIDNIELHQGDSEKFFESQIDKNETYDIVILDPPRKGCSQNSLDYALKLAKSKIIYISCNPATLSRDLKYLTSCGAKIESVQPFDMFCHTTHIETVVIVNT